MSDKGPRRIGDLLGQVISRYGGTKFAIMHEIQCAWRELVDDRTYQHSRLSSVKGGVLEILVDNSTLLAELEGFQKADLLEGFQKRVKQTRIKSIRLRKSSFRPTNRESR